MATIKISIINEERRYVISDMDAKTIEQLCSRLMDLDSYEIDDIDY